MLSLIERLRTVMVYRLIRMMLWKLLIGKGGCQVRKSEGDAAWEEVSVMRRKTIFKTLLNHVSLTWLNC